MAFETARRAVAVTSAELHLILFVKLYNEVIQLYTLVEFDTTNHVWNCLGTPRLCVSLRTFSRGSISHSEIDYTTKLNYEIVTRYACVMLVVILRAAVKQDVLKLMLAFHLRPKTGFVFIELPSA